MKKGFTLIELLVVISIIGMLSSVVLVSLEQARVKARDARRISDFHQLDLGLKLYYDSHGYYPTKSTLGFIGTSNWCSGNSVAYWRAFTNALGFTSSVNPPNNFGNGYCYIGVNDGDLPQDVVFIDPIASCVTVHNGGYLFTQFEQKNHSLLTSDNGGAIGMYELFNGEGFEFKPVCPI